MRRFLVLTTLIACLTIMTTGAFATDCDSNCDSGPTSPVPEPATIGLMGAGVAAIGFASWRKNRKK